MSELNENLAVLANWFGVLAPIFIVWSWILLMRNKRREIRMIEDVKKNPGSRPVILIVSLLRERKDIRNQSRTIVNSTKVSKIFQTNAFL